MLTTHPIRKQFWSKILPFFLSFTLAIACSSSPQTNSSGSSPSPVNPTTAIPIGVAIAQTSNTALIGQEQILGAKIAEKFFNEQGGINGTPFKLVFQDSGGDEQVAINAFTTLINQDRVVGIIGPSASQQAFAADPIAERNQVPVVAASNTAQGIPQIGDYISRVSAPVVVVAPNAVKQAIKLNPTLKKVAVFYAQNDAFSKSETETFQQAIKELNLEIVTVQKFQTTDTDFQAQATNALNLKPDLIVISGWPADGGNLVKQLRELGYQGLMIGGNGLNTSNIFPICQKLCDGIIIAQAYSPELDNKINGTFRDIYKAQSQKDPPQFTAQAFAAVQVFVEALKAVDSKSKITAEMLSDPQALKQLRSELNKQILAGNYETPLGKISFSPEGEVKQEKFFVAQIKMDSDGKNGKFTFLK
jgi:branched-chain amino acid transport system substrate-binding protein